jgi:hypothetical protein
LGTLPSRNQSLASLYFFSSDFPIIRSQKDALLTGELVLLLAGLGSGYGSSNSVVLFHQLLEVRLILFHAVLLVVFFFFAEEDLKKLGVCSFGICHDESLFLVTLFDLVDEKGFHFQPSSANRWVGKSSDITKERRSSEIVFFMIPFTSTRLGLVAFLATTLAQISTSKHLFQGVKITADHVKPTARCPDHLSIKASQAIFGASFGNGLSQQVPKLLGMLAFGGLHA